MVPTRPALIFLKTQEILKTGKNTQISPKKIRNIETFAPAAHLEQQFEDARKRSEKVFRGDFFDIVKHFSLKKICKNVKWNGKSK